MRVCLVGGIFDKPEAYRRHHRFTPETVLHDQLLSLGVEIEAVGHSARIDPARYDIIHVHHLGRGILGAATRKAGAKLVFTSHDGPLLCGTEHSVRKHAAFRFALSRADATVALSEVERRFLEGLAPTKRVVALIPNGIPADVYYPDGPDQCSEEGRLLFVGQLVEVKGVDTLIRAIAEVVEHEPVRVKFIYQNAKLEEKNQHLARALGLDECVEFAGARYPEELADEYRRARLVVLPSRAECFPSVIIEALLCGTPVVASDVGGIAEQVGPYGSLVPPNDPTALATAIRTSLVRHGTYQRRLLRDRPTLVNTYSPSQMGVKHLELYTRLLA